MYAAREKTVAKIGALFGISRGTVYEYVGQAGEARPGRAQLMTSVR